MFFFPQLEQQELDTGLVLHIEDKKIADMVFNVGSKNKTTVLVVSLWQERKLLQDLTPHLLQVHLALCTNDLHRYVL